MRRAALLAVLLLPGMAAAQVDGTWSLDCGAGPEGTITISGDRIDFYESACTLAGPVSVRDMAGAVLYDATCTGEGETWSKRILLMPALDGGLVRVEEGLALIYRRCE